MAKRSLTQEQVEEYRQRSLAQHDSAVRELLEPGETLHGVATASLHIMIKDPPLRYMPKGDRLDNWLARFERAGDKVEFAPGDAFWRFTGFLTREKPSMSGGWESQAGQFAIIVFAAGKQGRTDPRYLSLAVTDRRLLLMTRPGLRSFRLLREYAPGAIAVRPGWQLKR